MGIKIYEEWKNIAKNANIGEFNTNRMEHGTILNIKDDIEMIWQFLRLTRIGAEREDENCWNNWGKLLYSGRDSKFSIASRRKYTRHYELTGIRDQRYPPGLVFSRNFRWISKTIDRWTAVQLFSWKTFISRREEYDLKELKCSLYIYTYIHIRIKGTAGFYGE